MQKDVLKSADPGVLVASLVEHLTPEHTWVKSTLSDPPVALQDIHASVMQRLETYVRENIRDFPSGRDSMTWASFCMLEQAVQLHVIQTNIDFVADLYRGRMQRALCKNFMETSGPKSPLYGQGANASNTDIPEWILPLPLSNGKYGKLDRKLLELLSGGEGDRHDTTARLKVASLFQRIAPELLQESPHVEQKFSEWRKSMHKIMDGAYKTQTAVVLSPEAQKKMRDETLDVMVSLYEDEKSVTKNIHPKISKPFYRDQRAKELQGKSEIELYELCQKRGCYVSTNKQKTIESLVAKESPNALGMTDILGANRDPGEAMTEIIDTYIVPVLEEPVTPERDAALRTVMPLLAYYTASCVTEYACIKSARYWENKKRKEKQLLPEEEDTRMEIIGQRDLINLQKTLNTIIVRGTQLKDALHLKCSEYPLLVLINFLSCSVLDLTPQEFSMLYQSI